MSTEKYNGWTNYETWNCKLWMDNDQGSQRYWAEQAQDAWDLAEADKIFSREENAAHDLREKLQEFFEGNMPEVQGFYADILGAALSEVNWHEIAEALISDDVEKEPVKCWED